jgi:hypothetical protein
MRIRPLTGAPQRLRRLSQTAIERQPPDERKRRTVTDDENAFAPTAHFLERANPVAAPQAGVVALSI